MMVATDLLNPDFWVTPEPERDAVLARLRAATDPVPLPLDRTYALTRYADVIEASRNPAVFSSEPITTSITDPPQEQRELFGSMISMDDPRHARMRRIVSRAFTPRMIGRLLDDVEKLAADLVDRLVDTGPCDFVGNVAAPFPLRVICDMVGVPAAMYDAVVEASDTVIVATGNPTYVAPDGRDRITALTDAMSFLHTVMHELAEDRRAHPADDLVTSLISASVDGEALTDRELGRFFVLLIVAGNETTRNAISHALRLFTEHPAQRALLLSDPDTHLPGAVEEVLRHASPVRWMRRTVTQEYELSGSVFQPDDRVVLYYTAANRDPSVFPDPATFDITRSPNPHVGFGAPGPHFCLGAHLARREITVMLRLLYTRLPTLQAIGDPVRQRSSFISGIQQLSCTF